MSGGGRGGLFPPLELESEPGTCGRDSAGLELKDSTIFVARRRGMPVERPVGSGPAELEICRNAEFQFHRNEQESTAFSAFDWDRLHLME